MARLNQRAIWDEGRSRVIRSDGTTLLRRNLTSCGGQSTTAGKEINVSDMRPKRCPAPPPRSLEADAVGPTRVRSRRTIAETYCWNRGIGHNTRNLEHARIVIDPLHPNVSDTNHADGQSARAFLRNKIVSGPAVIAAIIASWIGPGLGMRAVRPSASALAIIVMRASSGEAMQQILTGVFMEGPCRDAWTVAIHAT
jgi:hypothetical protein